MFDAITPWIDNFIDTGKLANADVVILKDGDTAYSHRAGVMSLASGKPLRDDAIFRIYSMTKPVVSVAVLMLMDEGLVGLHDPVAKFIPGFAKSRVAMGNGEDDAPCERELSVFHLLTHTGGFPFTTLTRPLSEYVDLAAVAAEAADTELLFEPGARFEYSDAGSDTPVTGAK